MQNKAEKWVDLEAAAKHLGIKICTLYKWLERGSDFPAYKAGRVWRCKLSEVDAWVTKKNS